MRRKYFIRGMGLGIIITTVIFMGVLFFKGDSKTMTRGEIIQRATELGMVMPDNATMNDSKDEENTEGDGALDAENTDVADAEGETAEGENPEDAIPEENQASVTVENLEGDDVTPPPASTESTTSPVEDSHSAANNTQANTTPAPSTPTTSTPTTTTPTTTTPTTPTTSNNGRTKSFTIRGGESSATVGAHLYEQGLVDSASGFDRYLETNGYDKSIHTGTFSISEGSSYETIAKIITGQ